MKVIVYTRKEPGDRHPVACDDDCFAVLDGVEDVSCRQFGDGISGASEIRSLNPIRAGQ
jgi:hypothetical protein